MSTTTTAWPTQILLPGQAAAPEGPLDMWMMYVSHHAYRRDLADFASAAAHTPVEDRATWRALERRFDLFGQALHHHHGAEDAALWPLLRQRATGDEVRMLDDMEAEHAGIDPALEAIEAGLAALASGSGGADTRAALVVRCTAAREALGRHLDHEETEAIALMQRVMTAEEWHEMVETSFRPAKLTLAMVKNMLGWTMTGLPDSVRQRLFGELPAGRLIYALTIRGYQRRERAAFRYARA